MSDDSQSSLVLFFSRNFGMTTPKELLASTSLAAFIAARPPSTVVTVSSSDKLEHVRLIFERATISIVFFYTHPGTSRLSCSFSTRPLSLFFFTCFLLLPAQVLRLFASRNILSAPVIDCPSFSSSPSSSPNARCLGFVGVEDVLRAVLSFAGFSASSSSSPSSSSSSTPSLDAAVLASSTPAAREEGLRRASERLCSTSVREIQREGDGRLVFRCVSGGGGAERRKGGGGGGGGGAGEHNGAASPSSLPPPSGETSLLDVVRDGFLLGEEKGSPACHRVAVVDFEEDDFEDDFEDDGDDDEEDDEEGDETMRAARPPPDNDPDSDSVRVVAIVSQSDVIRFLARHLGELKSGEGGGEGGGEPTARELASAPVAAVAAAMPASLAFASLFQQRQRVSAAAILGTQRGELVGSLSASDLRGLSGAPGSLRALGLPVGEFVEARAAATAAAAAAAASAAASAAAGDDDDDDDDGGDDDGGGGLEAARRAPSPLLAVSPDTPFSELVRLLAEGGHHRAYVVEEIDGGGGSGGGEEEGGGAGGGGGGEAGTAAVAAVAGGSKKERRRRATGVISLSDVLRFACK